MKLSELEKELWRIAVEKAKQHGLATADEDVQLTLRIKGHMRAHEDWSTDISEEQWKKILSLPWDADQLSIFKLLHARNNEYIDGSELRRCEISLSSYNRFKDIHKIFRAHFLPFHLGPIIPMSRYKSKEDATRFRLFNKRPS